MEKIIIYTNDACPYCKQIKEELNKKEIKFENRLTKDHKKTWHSIVDLTGMATVPTIEYKNNYFIPNRDFGNAQGLINALENYKVSEFSEPRQLLERTKTLSTNIIMAFQRMDGILKKIETKINTDEHKSTN